MNTLVKYILFYLLFGFLGFFFEWMIGFQTSFCGDLIMRNLNLCVPFLNVYAIGGIMLLLLRDSNVVTNPFYFAVIAGLMLTIFECVSGHISQASNNGTKLWDYSDKDSCHIGVACNGFISFDRFILWGLIAFVIDIILRILKQ